LEKNFFGRGGILWILYLNFGLHHLPHLSIDSLDVCGRL
jgi:hypothetical protein